MKETGSILIMDPDPTALMTHRSLLECEGYRVESRDRFSGSVVMMSSERFDCVILDVDLRDVKWYDAIKIIRSVDPEIEIILTANRNTKPLEARIRTLDIFYYYIKSFHNEELLTAVRNLFNSLGKEIKEMKDGHATILVIDDDDDFLKSMKIILESASYRFLSAANPQEGMEKIKSEHPDLILLDIMMDSLFDGFSMCHTLKTTKEYRSYRHVPVIFVSAVKQKVGSRFTFDYREQGMAGPDDYLDKPVDPEQLLECIKKHLKRIATGADR
ncbi:response regulator [Candidatus Neomarinimicrobiota bacterium]